MPHRTHEQTINTALGEILEGLGQDWVINSEDIGRIFEDGGRPDILIQKSDGWSLVIEAEVDNHHQAELEAQARLGKQLTSGVATIDTAVALVYPRQIRTHAAQELRKALQAASFQFALFSLEEGTRITRFPVAGWLSDL